ncbi:hypothetical protein RFI_27054 [Reticulomyxa filosa]|uniref:Uncharacterized protein n=1 Tax=Reticulomyxa filosa TaxID=46433 RepID=X6M8T8_RETFI|nr:hypothetical protein RFI_27054 [Reticulomyxa filosa]|eukprot:ETO10324.1 hypothetical protein RFI_27054 [Reticulomyxa filosa]
MKIKSSTTKSDIKSNLLKKYSFFEMFVANIFARKTEGSISPFQKTLNINEIKMKQRMLEEEEGEEEEKETQYISKKLETEARPVPAPKTKARTFQETEEKKKTKQKQKKLCGRGCPLCDCDYGCRKRQRWCCNMLSTIICLLYLISLLIFEFGTSGDVFSNTYEMIEYCINIFLIVLSAYHIHTFIQLTDIIPNEADISIMTTEDFYNRQHPLFAVQLKCKKKKKYIYICTYTYICIYTYIYMYIHYVHIIKPSRISSFRSNRDQKLLVISVDCNWHMIRRIASSMYVFIFQTIPNNDFAIMAVCSFTYFTVNGILLCKYGDKNQGALYLFCAVADVLPGIMYTIYLDFRRPSHAQRPALHDSLQHSFYIYVYTCMYVCIYIYIHIYMYMCVVKQYTQWKRYIWKARACSFRTKSQCLQARQQNSFARQNSASATCSQKEVASHFS